MTAQATAEELLQQIKKLGATQKDALFACGGNVELDKPVSVYYNAGSSIQAIQFPSDTQSLDSFLAECQPAGFGLGKELVMDPSYRSALELDCDRWLTNFHLSENAILSEIHTRLAPDAPNIRARLYKLNVYKQGGFFKAHVDTPRGNNMFGTLVVCLPSEFTGGDFEVEHNGQKHAFVWGKDNDATSTATVKEGDKSTAVDGSKTEDATTTQKTTPLKARWCAFYSDCTHQVLEVTSGCRVTLTYFLESDGDSARQPPNAIETNPFVAKLASLLQTDEFGDKGQQLGFALEHKYTIDAKGTIPMLKGFDRFVKDALDSLGVKYKFAPVFLASKPSPPVSDDYYEPEVLSRRLVGQDKLQATDLDDYEVYVGSWSHMGRPGGVESYNSDTYFLEYVIHAETSYAVRWVISPTNMFLGLPATACGNQPESVEYYATAAFLVQN